MNLNPVANGNKTKSGLAGVILTAVVLAVLKNMGIEDDNGVITATIVGLIITGGWTLYGAIHKVIKHFAAKKAAK